MSATHRFRFRAASAALLVVLIGDPTGSLAGSARAQAQAPDVETDRATGRIALTAGRSTVLMTDFDIVRIAITNPEVADARVVEARQILIDGRAGGTVSLIVWGTDQRSQYDVVVEPGATVLQQELQDIFPGEDIRVRQIEGAVVLSGTVSNEALMFRAVEVAEATSADVRIINMLQLPAGQRSQQVLLQVRFAEVSRRAVTELGAALFTGSTGFEDFIGRGTTQQFAAPDFDDLQASGVGDVESVSGGLTFSDFLNLFVFDTKRNVGALIRALDANGDFQSLAEPNLIAYNGQEASFLAGGEFPVPVVQGITGAVTILFKEFGVRLNFLPIINGDVIRLRVTPEVSSLDFVNGLSIGGFTVPALITRRAETTVELRDGQTFAIAGLLNHVAQEDRTAIPILSRIPIIGNLFKSKSTRTDDTELMVLITPRLVRPLDPDEVPPLPTLRGSSQRLGDDEIGTQLAGGGGLLDGPSIEAGHDEADPAARSR